MNIARIVDGELRYPYSLGQLRADFPNTSWPAEWALIDLASVGCVEVQAVEPPACGEHQSVEEAAPVLVDGQWRQAWTICDDPPAVPTQVPAHHLRRALRAAGVLASVQAMIDALPPDHDMRDDWQYAPYFRRDAVGIGQAAQMLGLTDEQLDAIFIAAGQVVT